MLCLFFCNRILFFTTFIIQIVKLINMKKIVYPVFLSAVLLTACSKKEENKIQEPMTDPPVESVNNAPQTTAEDVATIPSFKYAEADQFAQEYSKFVSEFKTATANNDKEALKTLGPKLNDYQKRGVELAKRVPQDEAVAFQDFLSKLESYIK